MSLFPNLSPAPVATPSPAVPEPTRSEKQAGGDPFVSRLRRRCHACGAEPGVFCVRQPGDPAMVLVHRGRL